LVGVSLHDKEELPVKQTLLMVLSWKCRCMQGFPNV